MPYTDTPALKDIRMRLTKRIQFMFLAVMIQMMLTSAAILFDIFDEQFHGENWFRDLAALALFYTVYEVVNLFVILTEWGKAAIRE